MTTLNVYMAMYSNEITWAAALLIGFGVGALIFNMRGYEKGNDEGFDLGYKLGERDGINLAANKKPPRDRQGRFTPWANRRMGL